MIRVSATDKEVRAVRFAYDELLDYYEVVGEEASLDDEEMPTGLMFDALVRLNRLLKRMGNDVGEEPT